MLIIFDLDDTLIDTSGCITPVKLKDALEKMAKAGLPIGDITQAYTALLEIDRRSLSSRHALKEFLTPFGNSFHFFEIAEREIYENLSPELEIIPFPGVIDTLRELGTTYQLAIVTQGKPDQQIAKMKKAGIDCRIFSKIIASENKNKKFHYEQVVKELGITPSATFVCGDKIEIDLVPAKELGMTTVHMRKGRGKNQTEPAGSVDHTIWELAEIKEAIR